MVELVSRMLSFESQASVFRCAIVFVSLVSFHIFGKNKRNPLYTAAEFYFCVPRTHIELSECIGKCKQSSVIISFRRSFIWHLFVCKVIEFGRLNTIRCGKKSVKGDDFDHLVMLDAKYEKKPTNSRRQNASHHIKNAAHVNNIGAIAYIRANTWHVEYIVYFMYISESCV